MPNAMEIRETKPPGTLWATSGLLQDPFTLFFRVPKGSVTIDLQCDVRLVYAERELTVSWAMTGVTREVGTCSGGRQ